MESNREKGNTSQEQHPWDDLSVGQVIMGLIGVGIVIGFLLMLV